MIKISKLEFALMFSILVFSGCNFGPTYNPSFTSPQDGQHFATSLISLEGALKLELIGAEKKYADKASKMGPAQGHLKINSNYTPAISGSSFHLSGFPLKPGANAITATYDGFFRSDSTTITVYYDVAGTPPNSVFTENSLMGSTQLLEAFDASGSSTSNGSITHYSWDFGDGTKVESGTATITHAYQNAGIHTVILKVTDSSGLQASSSQSLTLLPSSSGVTDSSGVSVNVSGYGSVTFAAGTVPVGSTVAAYVTQSSETANDFAINNDLLSTLSRVDFELRINSGAVIPAGPVHVKVNLPAAYVSSLPNGARVSVFAQMIEDGGEEVLDDFEILTSSLDMQNAMVEVDVPVAAFTNLRSDDGSHEAILIAAALPAHQAVARVQKQSSGDCQANPIASPLSALSVESLFAPPAHEGGDFAATGVPVLAVQDGVVLKAGVDERALKRADPKSGKSTKGWGQYVVLQHSIDGSKTLYAHLQMGTAVLPGTIVSQGQMIATSGNSGGANVPHLHFEYLLGDSLLKVDPTACITGAQFSSDKNQLDFQLIDSRTPQSQNVTLANTGSRAISPVVTIDPPAPWLTVAGLTDIPVGGSINLVLTVNPARVSGTGTVTSALTISDAQDSAVLQKINLSVTVPTLPPSSDCSLSGTWLERVNGESYWVSLGSELTGTSVSSAGCHYSVTAIMTNSDVQVLSTSLDSDCPSFTETDFLSTNCSVMSGLVNSIDPSTWFRETR